MLIDRIKSDEADVEQSDDENLYRTGHIIGIKKESEFVQNLLEKYKKHNAIYLDYKEMIRLGMIDIEEHGD